MKVNPYQIDPKEKYIVVSDMFEVISGLGSKKEIANFFLGLFTPSEALMIARRIQIAKMILDGYGYDDIRKKLKVGNNNIQQIDRWIHEDGLDFSNLIKSKVGKQNKKTKNSYNTESLLDKYPYHRFIRSLFG